MRRARDLVGLVLAVVGIGFVVTRLAGEWDAVGDAVADAQPAWLVFALASGAFGIALVGVLWGVVLRSLGAAVRTGGGVPRRVAYRSVVLSLAAFYGLLPALPAWIAIVGATAALAHAVGGDVDLVRVAVATWVSWTAGFVASARRPASACAKRCSSSCAGCRQAWPPPPRSWPG